MSVALIKFLQGAVTGPNGQMIVGTVGNFTVANSNNAGVGSWQIDLVYVPPGSARSLATPLAHNDSGSTPTVVIAADVSGCYRVVLKVWNAAGRSGLPDDVDIRVFGVPEAQGTIVPPSQVDPEELDPAKKPNEMNLAGNLNGWAGGGAGDGLMNDTLKKLDAGVFSGRLLVKVVVTQDIANLAAFPSSFSGYAFQNGDLLALARQSNTSHNVVGTYNAGVFTPAPRQPNDGTQIIPTEGAAAYSGYIYRPSSVTLPLNTGTVQGLYTTTTYGPDGVGVSLIGNEAVPRQSVANDAAWHPLWSFDHVGRGFITGRLKIVACVMAIDGAVECELNLRANVTLSATPAAGALPSVTPVDIIDNSGGSGGFADMRFFNVGTATQLQVKNLQGGPVKFGGIVGLVVGQP